MKKIAFVLISILLVSCHDAYEPKPRGFLALDLPTPHYKYIQQDLPYTFKYNSTARVLSSFKHKPTNVDINYPEMKGTIYITYEPVVDNLKKLLEDAQNLPLKHTIKADQIIGNAYTNTQHNTYGMLYEVTGNAASQVQFYLTDSVANFITGSVYFRLEPNYDSIYPAAQYLKQDVEKIMETLQWQ